MTNTATETTEDEITPFVDNDREIAYRSEATPQASHGPAGRPAVVAPSGATGRRKEAVARVRIIPGSGQWSINGRNLEDYFPNKVHQQIVAEPFTAAAVAGSYDVDPGTGEAGHDGRFETLTRGARIPADQCDGTTVAESTALGQHGCRGHGKAERQLGGELLVGSAANSIGAEDSGLDGRPLRGLLDHRGISACCTAAPCGPSSDPPSCAP